MHFDYSTTAIKQNNYGGNYIVSDMTCLQLQRKSQKTDTIVKNDKPLHRQLKKDQDFKRNI